MTSHAKEFLQLAYVMHDDTVKYVRMYIFNLPEETSSGKTVSSGSMHFNEIAKELRGCFNVYGENQDQVEAVVHTSGPIGFCFDYDNCDKKYEMSMRLLDEKGNFPDGDDAIVPRMTCFCENVGQKNQFSTLVIRSKQGKEQGLRRADKDSGVVTLRSRFNRDPEVYRSISKAVTRGGGGVTRGGGFRGPPEKSSSCEVGFGDFTGTTWTKSNLVAASAVKNVTFRIKVAQPETEKPVPFASTWEEAQKKYGPPKFVPDESSDDDETSSDDKKRKSDDDGMSSDDKKRKSDDDGMSSDDKKRKSDDDGMSDDDQQWRLLY